MFKSKLFLSIAAVVFIFSMTVDSYSQWTYASGITGIGTFGSISIADQNTVWAAGGPTGVPFVARSTNFASSFTPTGTSGISLELYCVTGRDANTCYAGDGGAAGGSGGNAHVYKTTNGGTSWTVILSTGGTVGFINGIPFSKVPGSQIGVAESDPPTANGPYWWQLTTNNGATWTPINGPTLGGGLASAQNTPCIVDQLFFSVGSSAASGTTGKVITTSNGGSSWISPTLPITGSQAFVSCVSFNTNKLDGIAALSTSLPNVAITHDGGATWTSKNVGAGLTAYCVAFWVPGSNVIYVLGQTGTPAGRKSTDGGNTWTNYTTASINGFTCIDGIVAGGNVYMVGIASDGSVVKLTEPYVPVGVNPNNNNVPKDYVLEQNYPNPFNPTTNINYSIPRSSDVSIKIYDMLGNSVMTVVNEHKEAGNYTANVDASRLSSGVYFYSLQAGDFKASKKMTLVK